MSSCTRAKQVFYPDVTVEEGIRIFLTGGMALPNRLTSKPYDHNDDELETLVNSRSAFSHCAARVGMRVRAGRCADGAGRSRWRLLAGAAAQAASRAQHMPGGEVNIHLPDLNQGDFLGMTGHQILMSGLVVCVLGLLFGAWTYAGVKSCRCIARWPTSPS